MTQQENLKAIVDDWWNSLDQFEQGEIIDNNYPDDSHLLDNDEAWEGLPWNTKLETYLENNPGELTEPDFDDEYHRKKEEENEPH
jgi:hypothetical protein